MADEGRREDETELGEGHDPTEDVGPEEAGVSALQTEFKPGELEGPPERCQVNFAEEIAEAYKPEREIMVPHPLDGLPTPGDERQDLAIAPPFSIEHVVCVEDTREYRELFEEEVLARGTYPLASPETYLTRLRWDADGHETRRHVFPADRVIVRWGLEFVAAEPGSIPEFAALDRAEILVPVAPRRERCRHYKRQVFSNDDQPDENEPGHRIIFRNCEARRSVGGANLSLRDQAVYACEYRDPPDLPSVEKHLDTWDRAKLADEPHRIRLPFLGRA